MHAPPKPPPKPLPPLALTLPPPAPCLRADAVAAPLTKEEKAKQSMEELTNYTREMAVLLLLFVGLRAVWHAGIPTLFGGERPCFPHSARCWSRCWSCPCLPRMHRHGVELARPSLTATFWP